MSHRFLASMGAVGLVIVIVSLAPATVAGQSQSGAPKTSKTWAPIRTADGQPDLQGIWDFRTLTPMERPRELAGKQFFTDEEAAEFEKQTLERGDNDRRDEDVTRRS